MPDLRILGRYADEATDWRPEFFNRQGHIFLITTFPTHSNSCKNWTRRTFSEDKSGRGVGLTIHLYLVLTLSNLKLYFYSQYIISGMVF